MTAPANLVLLSSRGGGHCMHIAECIARGALPNLHLTGIVTDQPDAGVIAKAAARGIRIELVDPRRYATRAEFDTALAERVALLQPALVGLVGYLRIVRAPLLGQYPGRLFNLHPSLLPAYPGLDSIARAFADGVRRLGATLHHVDAGIDTGAPIARQVVHIKASATLAEATAAVHGAEALMLERALASFDPQRGFPNRLLNWPDLTP